MTSAGTSPPCERTAPASFAQEGLWFLSQLDDQSVVYNRPASLRLTGPLDTEALAASLQQLVQRHEALRTTFALEGDQLVQHVRACEPLSLPIVNLDQLTGQAADDRLNRLAVGQARMPFNLAVGPLMRLCLVRLAEDDHVLLLTFHHIIFDGWSVSVLVRDLSALYEAHITGASPQLPDLPLQYIDYSVTQRHALKDEAFGKTLDYWKNLLAGELPSTELFPDHPRPAQQTFEGKRETLVLPAPLARELRALARSQKATLFMVLLAAFQVLLRRHTGQDDLVVGCPIAGRNRLEYENLIGLMVNYLVLRGDLAGDPTFIELVSRTRTMALQAFTHQDLPFERLVQELAPPRDAGRNAIFQIMFQLRNLPADTAQAGELRFRPFKIDPGVARLDLVLEVTEADGALVCTAEYNTALFEAATINRLIERWRTLLAGIVAAPEQRMSRLPVLPDAERRLMLEEWNQTAADYPQDACLHSLFEAQTERTPDATALVHRDEKLTYRELNERANQVAHHLRTLGVKPETCVGLCMPRNLRLIVGYLAILKAGGACVPLQPTLPRKRLAFMMKDAAVAAIVTETDLVELLRSASGSTHPDIVLLDDAPVAPPPEGNPDSGVNPDNLAYVMYTSGSTGQPKGVAIAHRGPVSLVCAALKPAVPQAIAGVLFTASVSFDQSVEVIFSTLAWGGTLIIVEDLLEFVFDPPGATVTTVATVPSAMAEMLRIRPLPESVRTVRLVGEALPGSLVEQLYASGHVRRVTNCYGPTETSIFSTLMQVPSTTEGPPPIGRPVGNTQIYVLDNYLLPVPVGVPGELCIGGAGLARGYVNQPELTARAFVPHPFDDTPGARLYRTGDIARWLPTGELEALGRRDDQVKLRGFRVELGEIESVLREHEDVYQAVVLTRADDTSDPTDRKLAAYIVPRPGRTIRPAALRTHAERRLPDYMVPAAYVVLESIPMNPSGKIDRPALPAPDRSDMPLDGAAAEPEGELETCLRDLWEKTLKVRPIGVEDNFFDLGGHSLLAARLASRVESTLGRRLPPPLLFAAPTIRALARAMRDGNAGGKRATTQDITDAGVTASGSADGIWTFSPAGSRQASFWIPGGNARDEGVLLCGRLSRCIGADWPLHALAASELYEAHDDCDCAEDLATQCIRRIRAVQPWGPYVIGGICLGSLLAFEIAQQLRAGGDEVSALVLVDAVRPGTVQHLRRMRHGRNFGSALRKELQNVRRMSASDRRMYVRSRTRLLLSRLRRGAPLWNLTTSDFAQAMRRYVPEPYAGRMYLVATDELASDDATLGWGPVAVGGLEVLRVRGGHWILQLGDLQEVADQLRACLEREEARDGRT